MFLRSFRSYRSRTTTARSRGRSSLLADVGHIRAGLRELEVAALNSAATISDVGDEHGWAAAEGITGTTDGEIALGSTATDGDNGAVHVHLAVADLVEPAPAKEGLTSRGVVGEGEVVAGVTLDRAVSDVRVDDGPSAATVVGQGGLAATTIVRGATGDGHAVRLTRSPGGDRLTLRSAHEVVVALAREVASITGERVGHGVVDVSGEVVELASERRRVLHLHVSGGKAE